MGVGLQPMLKHSRADESGAYDWADLFSTLFNVQGRVGDQAAMLRSHLDCLVSSNNMVSWHVVRGPWPCSVWTVCDLCRCNTGGYPKVTFQRRKVFWPQQDPERWPPVCIHACTHIAHTFVTDRAFP
jgi:hypothetical protein